MNVITQIATALPSYQYRQADLANFMCELFQYPQGQARRLQLMYSKSGIETRYSVIPDFSVQPGARKFFPKTSNLEPFPSIEYRMQYFHKTALGLSMKAIDSCIRGKIPKKEITHLITVSCTGLAAPGLDIDLVQQIKLNENINRTSVNFMGCYAAIHAMKQADYICSSDPEAVVLVVCVELCTIHFQKTNDIDNLTANLLFADGAAAMIVVPESYAVRKKMNGFGIKKFNSRILLNGKTDMAWQLSSTGFIMTLSAYIPQLIKNGFKSMFDKSMRDLGITAKSVTHWAIHPGGRKILEVIQKELDLKNQDLESSYRVLRNHGNMSSPTILFVLKDIWDHQIKIDKKEKTFGVAFGPGLTMESVILENV